LVNGAPNVQFGLSAELLRSYILSVQPGGVWKLDILDDPAAFRTASDTELIATAAGEGQVDL